MLIFRSSLVQYMKTQEEKDAELANKGKLQENYKAPNCKSKRKFVIFLKK